MTTFDPHSDAPLGLPNSLLDAVLDSGLGNGAVTLALKFRRHTRGAALLQVVTASDLVERFAELSAAGTVDVIPLEHIGHSMTLVKGVESVSADAIGRRVHLISSDGVSGYLAFGDDELLVVVR